VDSPSCTVLVVDDDPPIRFLCRVNLELEGWTVCEAATIAHAREKLADPEIDVVLLDVHLGRESGVDFLAEVREQHPGLPVVLLTGSVGTADLDGVEADAVIAKPFEPAELTDTVRKLASRIAHGAG
jgi:two-component system KDP operon response regulator KdpE